MPYPVMNRADISAAGGATANNLKVVLVGDSQNAQYNIGGLSGVTSVHWLSQLNADPRVRGLFDVVANFASSGKRPDEWAPTQVPQALASGADVVVFGGWVNGMATPWNMTADQVMNGWSSGNGPAGASSSFIGLLAYAQQILDAGLILIWPSDWGQEGFNASQITQSNKANQRRRLFLGNRPRAYAFERNSIMWDGASTSIVFRSGFANDQAPNRTHNSSIAAYFQRLSAFEQLRPLIRSSLRQLDGVADNYGQGARQLLSNAGFSGSTGDKPGAGTVTGNVPNGWRAVAPSGMSVTVSLNTSPAAEVVPGLAENIPEFVVNISSVSADGVFVLRYDFAQQGQGARFVAGHVIRGYADVAIDAGSVGVYGPYLDLFLQTDGSVNNEVYSLWNQFATGSPSVDYGVGPTVAYTQALGTPKLIVPAYTTFSQGRFDIAVRVKSGGSGTIRVRAPIVADLSV